MPTISQQEAIERAEAFIPSRRSEHLCGAFQSVKHVPADEKMKRYTGRESGCYYVEFAYSGPPPRELTLPRQDHPIVVIVDDESGECRVINRL